MRGAPEKVCERLFYCCFTVALLPLYCGFTAAAYRAGEKVRARTVLAVSAGLLVLCWCLLYAAALLLLTACFTAALLLLNMCFTAACLYCGFTNAICGRGCAREHSRQYFSGVSGLQAFSYSSLLTCCSSLLTCFTSRGRRYASEHSRQYFSGDRKRRVCVASGVSDCVSRASRLHPGAIVKLVVKLVVKTLHCQRLA